MNGTRRTLAVLGGGALVVLPAVLFLRGKRVDPVRPAQVAEAQATSDPAPAPPAPRRGADAAEARRARDAMRERIVETLRRRAAEARAGAPGSTAAPAPAAPAPADEIPTGRYDAAYIRQTFREDMFPLMKSCYGDALLRKPKLAGSLVLKFSIVGAPSVGGVIDEASYADESDLDDDEMRTCVRESLMTLTFDKVPEGGGKVTVAYPVAFAPDDDGQGDGR